MERDWPRTLKHVVPIALIALGMFGLASLPAAGFVSAAGRERSPTWLGTSSPVGEGISNTGSHMFIFLPLVMENWPPVPYAPVLEPIESPVWERAVVLHWYGDVPTVTYPVDYYLLQEATSTDFTAPVNFTVPVASVPFTVPQKPYGTMGRFYYRVRAHNAWGLGAWSNVESMLLLSQRDEFDYPETGWAPRRTSYWDLDVMAAEYQGGELITRVEDRFDFTIFSPMRQAPAPPYRIRMATQIIHQANETSYGIIFGGNGGSFCGIERETAADPNGCFQHYYRLNVVWGNYLKYELKRVDYHYGPSGGGAGAGESWGYGGLEPWQVSDPNGWNIWEIRVFDTGFAVYVNDHYLRWVSDTTYLEEPYYGIFSSTYEYNGARFRHAYYFVEPLEGSDAVPPTPKSWALPESSVVPSHPEIVDGMHP